MAAEIGILRDIRADRRARHDGHRPSPLPRQSKARRLHHRLPHPHRVLRPHRDCRRLPGRVVVALGANAGSYFYRVQASVERGRRAGGFIKSIVFAVLVSMICCFQGYFCHLRTGSSGAKNVGLATRAAVVLSCTMILIADYVVTSLLM